MNIKPLCNAPFTSYSHKPEGYRPCCSRHAEPIQAESESDDWWNGEYMRTFRKKMFMYRTLPDECKACIDEQGSGGEKYSHQLDLTQFDFGTGAMNKDPSQVYLFTGNRCNLACEMCDSTFSDSHAKKFPERVLPVSGDFIDPRVIAKQYDPEQWVVYGGEPMLYDEIYDLVLLLLQKNGKISFLTNGMYNIKTSSVFELIMKYPHRFTMTFSIDGDMKLNEEIRHGASTKRILSNVKMCLESGVYTDIHFTHSTLNSHGFVDFCNMLIDYGLYDYRDFTINTCAVEYPSHFSPKTHNSETKRSICAEVTKFAESNIPTDMKKAADDIIASLQQNKVGDIL